MKNPRLVFMGSPDFALPSFHVACEFTQKNQGSILGVFTQPDRPKGRGKKMQPVGVAIKAMELGFVLFQPNSLKKGDDAKEAITFLKKQKPDCIIVVAYGLLLPKEVLDIPRLGCINVHASLLPQYRGAAPAQWAIANGETKTGITTMKLDEGLDTGPILLQEELEIKPEEYADELLESLSKVGAALLGETLTGLFQGTLKPKPQPKEGTYAPLLKKELAQVDWTKPAPEIFNCMRGFYPWPGSKTTYQGEMIKIHRARCGSNRDKGQPGEILSVSPEGITVQAGRGTTLVLLKIQSPGGTPQNVADYLRGNPIQAGILLN